MKTLIAIISLSVFAFAALPELKVSTKNNAAINSPAANLLTSAQQTANNCQNHLIFVHTYVPATTITLTGAANSGHNFSVSSGRDSIRGRGNSTWAGDKKPYRIKFDSAQSVFGSKKHKSWALLANWYDQTFALNAVGFELGKRIGIPGTPNQYLVDFYLNNEYKGIYQITDIVHVNKGRLEIDEKEGWLVEFDYHCPSTADEIDFATDYPNTPSRDSKLHTFIKSPEDLPKLSDYDFVKRDVNNLMTTMFNKSGFPNNGYRDLVDLESVAKYLMLEQFLDNFDFNNKSNNSGFPASNFFHKEDSRSKIKAGPIWDLDLIAGVEYASFPTHFKTDKTPVMPRHAFYKKFFEDTLFLIKFKKAWIKYKPDIEAMSKQNGFIDSIAKAVQGSVVKNFELQLGTNKTCNDNNTNTCKRGAGGFSGMAPIVLGNLQAYQAKVDTLKIWWGKRVTFFQQEMDKWNIDLSKDVIDEPSSSSSKPAGSSSSNTNSGSVTLTCTGLQQNVEKGANIAEPTLTCSNDSPATNPSWTGRPGGNSSWAVSATTSTPSYTIGVTATCGSSSGLSASCGTVAVGSDPIDPGDPTPIIIGKTIVLKNLPSNAKIEVYNLQGKLIYTSSGKSLNRENRGSDNLRIPVQTKGMYIIRIKQGNSTSTYQNRVHLN
ncbi:MAG: CotH kinase family protein [Fibromonadaceae bacterium]|jgi:hypothetical protein|nr:CotH kinase family protein [Fibromonadaceae bacterium]